MTLLSATSQKRDLIICVLVMMLVACSSAALGDVDSLRERILNKMNQLETTNESAEGSAALAQVNEHDEAMSAGEEHDALVQLNEVDQSKVQSSADSLSNAQVAQNVNGSDSSRVEFGSEVDEDQELIQVNLDKFLSHDDTFLQLASKGKMSFDCWSKTQSECESQYCVWTSGRCTISPSAYALLCDFYCEPSICVVPANSTEVSTSDADESCVPTPEAFSGLCTAIKHKETCALQGDLCTVTPKGQCVDSCCSKAKAYCKKSPKKQSTLNTVMLACGSYTAKEDICEFSRKHCGAAVGKKP